MGGRKRDPGDFLGVRWTEVSGQKREADGNDRRRLCHPYRVTGWSGPGGVQLAQKGGGPELLLPGGTPNRDTTAGRQPRKE